MTISVFRDMMFFFGLCLTWYGCWALWAPIGFIVCGVSVTAIAFAWSWYCDSRQDDK